MCVWGGGIDSVREIGAPLIDPVIFFTGSWTIISATKWQSTRKAVRGRRSTDGNRTTPRRAPSSAIRTWSSTCWPCCWPPWPPASSGSRRSTTPKTTSFTKRGPSSTTRSARPSLDDFENDLVDPKQWTLIAPNTSAIESPAYNSLCDTPICTTAASLQYNSIRVQFVHSFRRVTTNRTAGDVFLQRIVNAIESVFGLLWRGRLVADKRSWMAWDQDVLADASGRLDGYRSALKGQDRMIDQSICGRGSGGIQKRLDGRRVGSLFFFFACSVDSFESGFLIGCQSPRDVNDGGCQEPFADRQIRRTLSRIQPLDRRFSSR